MFTRALLDHAKSLVGSALLAVRYYDSPAEVAEGPLRDSAAFHMTHDGVDLVCDHGVVGVISSDQFTDGTNELSLLVGSVLEHHSDVDATQVNDESPWSALIGHTIVSSKIHWVDSPYIVLKKLHQA